MQIYKKSVKLFIFKQHQQLIKSRMLLDDSVQNNSPESSFPPANYVIRKVKLIKILIVPHEGEQGHKTPLWVNSET